MSDGSEAGPDLHAIFGIDGEPPTTEHTITSAEQTISTVEHTVASAPAEKIGEGLDLDGLGAEHEVALDPATVEMESVAEPVSPPVQEGEKGFAGITRPSRRGSSPRFLTDVIVDMGLASRKQVEEALEESRNSGTTPELVLLDAGRLTQDGLARALAERYGLDHLDLGVFQVDMTAANLVNTTVAKRYQAVPVAFADKRTLLIAMADPSNVLAVDDIAIMTGYEIRVAVAPPDDIATLVSRLDRLDDVVGDRWTSRRARTKARSLPSTRPLTTRPSSSSSTRSSRRRSSAAHRTSTSRRTAAKCACASASTACSRTSQPCRGAWRRASSRASRSWPS